MGLTVVMTVLVSCTTEAAVSPSGTGSGSPVAAAQHSSAAEPTRRAEASEPMPAPIPDTFSLTRSFAGTRGTAPFSDGVPAPAIAVGPSGLVLGTTDRIELMTKDGQLASSVALLDFYASVRAVGSEVKNPTLLFDPQSSRFFHVVSTKVPTYGCAVGSCRSHVLVAVSRSASPRTLGSEDWFFYAFNWTLEDGRLTTNIPEWGRLGIDERTVIITARTGPIDESSPAHSLGRIVDKGALLRGDPSPPTRDLVWTGESVLTPVLALDPLQVVFLLSRDGAGASCGLTVWRIDSNGGTPDRSSRTLRAPGPCAPLVDAPQPSAPRPLDLSTERSRLQAVYRDGSIWGTQTVPSDGGRTAVRWYQIDVSHWPDGVRFLQDARISDESAWLSYPALTVDPAGDVLVAFARASPSEFASVAYTGRRGDDPAGAMRPLATLKRGSGAISCADHTSKSETGSVRPDFRNRFAFQSGTAIDLTDGSVWLFGQYGRAGDIGCEFSTWIGRLDWSIVPGR